MSFANYNVIHDESHWFYSKTTANVKVRVASPFNSMCCPFVLMKNMSCAFVLILSPFLGKSRFVQHFLPWWMITKVWPRTLACRHFQTCTKDFWAYWVHNGYHCPRIKIYCCLIIEFCVYPFKYRNTLSSTKVLLFRCYLKNRNRVQWLFRTL